MKIKSERHRSLGDIRSVISSALQIFSVLAILVILVGYNILSQRTTSHFRKDKCYANFSALEQGGEEDEKWKEMKDPFYMF
ncbi:hypothetical protein DD237_007599 [Peronospora effusa]|uniref:Uncharacterized protein n=1 Tax=Peronospora effusa TaxID=542832 RepID=A0A425CPE8_9STRA|nr:hypothetical protein DD237_007599 [Peronospora effusa]